MESVAALLWNQWQGSTGIRRLAFGVALGAIPLAQAGLAPLVSSIVLIPPMAVLPTLPAMESEREGR